MKYLIPIFLFAFSPVFAQNTPVVPKTKVYRPFVYETNCILEYGIQTYYDVCKVIETRETGGALVCIFMYGGSGVQAMWEEKVRIAQEAADKKAAEAADLNKRVS